MAKEFEFDVFLSHNRADKPRVRQIAELLKAAGLQVWFDEWVIQPGDDIYLAIERGLEQSRCLVLFLSQAALDSDWVSLERSTALFRDPTNKDRRFVPVLLDDCQLPDTLKRYRYLDLRQDDPAAIEALIAAGRGEPGPLPPNPIPPPKPPARRRAPRNPASKLRGSSLAPALVALGCFIAGLILLLLLLGQAERWVGLRLEGWIFYLALVFMGLAAAGVLVGVMQSFARYRGKQLGGRVELKGAVVAFGLVVLGAYQMASRGELFSVTVFVHGESGSSDVPLRNQGRVFLDLAGDRRQEAIGEKGQAIFTGIPASFRGQQVRTWVEADGYETVQPADIPKLREGSLYLAVRRRAVNVHGQVKDATGAPVEGAAVAVRDLRATSDAAGSFRLKIPGPWTGENLTLHITKPGFQPWSSSLVPGSNDPVAVLQRAP